MAFFAALCYGFPSRHLKVIGVTGTKGKTTTVLLIHSILSASGVRVASLSSLQFAIGNDVTKNNTKMTMPGRMFVQKFLYDALCSGCKYVVLEVTSEGIKQFRHRFISFSGGIMTNIAREHIESHGGLEQYVRAKLDLFWRLPKDGYAVINRDDPYASRFMAATRAHVLLYGEEGILMQGKEHRVRNSDRGDHTISFEFEHHAIFSRLHGVFNFYNILTALAAGLAEHLPLEKIIAGISAVHEISGRMEFVQELPFRVVVDYAHTPESLEGVYRTLRNSKFKIQNSKLICVLGAAGGGRDRWKRPVFGKIAAEYCDEIILTNEDPYDENPHYIVEDIESGFSSNYPDGKANEDPRQSRDKLQITNYKKILDRRDAIREALALAREGDTVVITGKGAEAWIAGPNGTKIPWDDRKVVRDELQKI